MMFVKFHAGTRKSLSDVLAVSSRAINKICLESADSFMAAI